MEYRDHRHPVWRIGTILAVCALVVAVNYGNAQSFDEDDWERIVQLLGGLGVGAGIKNYLTRT